MKKNTREEDGARQLKANKRKMLRKMLLNELYDNHFDSEGKAKEVSKESLDSECALAYDYLRDRGYITLVSRGDGVIALKITASGIDSVERP
ncbi:hypothetical protein CSV71_05820 [Sporosarcina sp. P21c]|uniref:hypothetical protein n=1 Tax=unclassified Sporosarcina TaxID=2647733 RepID=UPI000C16B51C|nr:MULTISPECIES: hypothetical protein [unclassified Sporosarcina]PIC67274.1 hypothetical protein CSV78_08035 [Sporosarcina sp. P16a]PIC90218.1 hypothetical protein CSV71_05820 [Sporosarcina sp. P21c]PIC92726.1 hypothetical protein CSV70_08785 [Sporosarcina sp. P25]